MKEYKNGVFTGERALYGIKYAKISDSIFEDGESPLKECSGLDVSNCEFRWKYPLWYSHHIKVDKCTFLEMSRSGIWYTDDITITNSQINCPKLFRKCNKVTIVNSKMPNAQEFFWGSNDVTVSNVEAKGDYMFMNCHKVKVKDFKLEGNYAFDGASDIEIDNAYLDTKDSLWNTKNVIVRNSTIIGEYIGWNSENLVFINCKIDSIQAFCYIKNLTLIDCELYNTNLCFERCSGVHAIIKNEIESVKNPYSGYIKAKKIGEIILDKTIINPDLVIIETDE